MKNAPSPSAKHAGKATHKTDCFAYVVQSVLGSAEMD